MLQRGAVQCRAVPALLCPPTAVQASPAVSSGLAGGTSQALVSGEVEAVSPLGQLSPSPVPDLQSGAWEWGKVPSLAAFSQP